MSPKLVKKILTYSHIARIGVTVESFTSINLAWS